MEYKNTILIAAILTVFSILLFTGTTIITTEVIGVNTSTTTTRVWVWNTEPNLYDVRIIDDDGQIDLIAGNVTSVNCTGYIWDYNGWQDINVTNATFYNTRVSSNYGTVSYRKGMGYAGEQDAISAYTAHTFFNGLVTPSIGLSFTSYKLSKDSEKNDLMTLLAGCNELCLLIFKDNS